jgi:AcrR family transcriptional regulator
MDTKMTKRMPPEERRQSILAAAVKESRRLGYRNITRDGVAIAAGVTFPRVTQLFGDMPGLRRAIMRYAVEHADLVLLAQGLAHRDPIARRASAAVKKQVADKLTGVA